jgi:hypothetical protein
VGWGQYLNEMFSDLIGWRMPDAIAKAPGAGGVFNLPAVVLVGSCLILLLRGVKESVTVNAVLVVLKLLVLLFFVVIAFSGFHAQQPDAVRADGRGRDRGGGLVDLLLLYRHRRGLDGRRGGQGSAPHPAAGHRAERC